MSPLLALLALQGAPTDFGANPEYAKPITVELGMKPLRKVVAAMATASGKPLDVSGAVGEWNATMLVKDLPVGRAMEALADALGLVWRNDGGILRLGRPDGAATAEAAYAKEEAARVVDDLKEKTTGPDAPIVGPTGRPMRNPRRGPSGAPARPRNGAKAVYTRFDPDLLATEVADSTPPTRLEPAFAEGASAFAKATATWPSLPQTPDAAWSRPVAPAYPKAGWTSGRLSLADLLVAWHASSGLPVVADAFRVPMRSRSVAPAGALAALQALANGDRLGLKLANGVARMRHPAFWRLRVQEIPESAWLDVERGTPNLASLTAFASRLTPARAATFRSLEPPLSTIKTDALRTAYPALLLWSALPGSARTALLAGKAVGLAQVSGATNAYAFALREAPYYGSGDPTEVLAMNPAKVGIFGRSTPTSLSLRLAGERGEGVSYVVPL